MPQPLVTIDLKKILRSRLPRKVSRFVPDFAISWIERLICQDRLNELLHKAYPKEGSQFSDDLLRNLDISLEVEGFDRVPDGRWVFASNHPLGGLDGIALIKVLGEKYGDEHTRFLVNDMLMNVAPLRNVFLPVNKYGSQGRENAAVISRAWDDPEIQMLVFPAGLVSRLHPDGKIHDLEWKPTFVKRAISSGRGIVPVRFEALNTPFFYKFARWRKLLKIKVNIEQVLLPSELCKASGKRFRIVFGEPIAAEDVMSLGETPAAISDAVRRRAGV